MSAADTPYPTQLRFVQAYEYLRTKLKSKVGKISVSPHAGAARARTRAGAHAQLYACPRAEGPPSFVSLAYIGLHL